MVGTMMGLDAAAYQQLYQAAAYQQVAQAYAGMAGAAAPAAQAAQAAQAVQAQQALPQPQADTAECVGQLAHISVAGCSHATVGGIVRGNFTANGQNHGRPTYRKDQQVNGLDVMLYYWDERDGPNFCGWWFGPKVGGDQVWAYHNSRSAMTPPTRGWKVPYDGPVDETFSIGPVGAAPQAALPPAPVPQVPQVPQVPGFPAATPGSRQEQQAQMRLQHEQQRALQQQRIKEQEELKAKQQEMAARREEQARLVAERKQKEQESTSIIRMACQKIHIAKEETIQQLEQELYQTMQLHLPNCGFMMPKIREECEQVLLQTKKRLEDMARQKAIDEERKARMTEQAEKLVDDFNIKVAAAEEAAKMLTEKAEALTTIDTILQMSEKEIEQQNQVIQEAHKEANDRIKICHDYLQEYYMHMRVPDSPGQPPATVNVSLQKISERLTATTTDKDAILVKCSNCRKMADKKKEAQKVMEGINAKFKSYDSNKDGFLDKKEIIAYSKKEFKFPLAEKDVTKILKALELGTKGVPQSDFQKLKVRIGCLREKVLDDARRKKREARELELEGYKDEFKAKLTKLDESTESVEAEVKKVEDSMGEVKADTLKSFELKVKCEQAAALLKGAEEAVAKLKAKVTELRHGVQEDLKIWCLGESKFMDFKIQGFERRMAGLGRRQTQLEMGVKAKETREVDTCEKKVLAMLKHHQKAKSLSLEEMFKAVSKGDEEKVEKDAFLSFLTTCEKEEGAETFGPSELSTYFDSLDSEKEGFISKEHTLMLIRTLKKVIKETTLTDGPDVSSAAIVAKLEVGDVVELLSEPSEQGEMVRATCRSMRDGSEGWVTLKGNQGSTHLTDGGLLWRVQKETVLTEAFEETDAEADRKLRPGELIEVREWMRKDESGVMRMKCRAKMDGKVGWVTVVGNTGIVYLAVH